MLEAQCHFLEDTLLLLKLSHESRAAVARNAKVDYRWLSEVALGRISDPGVRRLWQLRRYLVKSSVNHSKNKALQLNKR